MRETRTSGSMSGEEKRSDGPLGERGHERRRAQLAPPVLYAAALLLDSTTEVELIKDAPASIKMVVDRRVASIIRPGGGPSGMAIAAPGAS